METRKIIQAKIFILVLNNMTGRMEERRVVCISQSTDDIINWYKSQLADKPYVDDRYHKTFKQGSPLEYMNPITDFSQPTEWGHGIFSDWILSETQDPENKDEYISVLDEVLNASFKGIHRTF